MKKEEISTYERAVEYILEVPVFTKKNDMNATKHFLEVLGHPERGRKLIHIAGTNGKGSVCAYLCSVLREAGFSVGMFISPHLVDIRERFQINGKKISEEQFLGAFLQVYEKIEGEYHPTFFEYLYFMALLLFRETGVEYCILETGLGGRLDATNAAETKEISIITKIGFDHMEYLGDTLDKIAAEKAGILRKNTPVVYYAGRPEVNAVIEKTAKQIGAVTVPVTVGRDAILKNTNKSIDFSFHSRYYGYIKLNLSTTALYQAENAALAVTALEVMGLSGRITKTQLTEGMHKAFWEGRMEEVCPGIFLDGAHNEDGIAAFLETVKLDACKGKRFLLFSVVHDKRFEAMVSALFRSGLFDAIGTAPLKSGRAATLEELETVFEPYRDTEHFFYQSVEEAFQKMRSIKGEGDYLYVVGSLYLVGQVKACLKTIGLADAGEKAGD